MNGKERAASVNDGDCVNDLDLRNVAVETVVPVWRACTSDKSVTLARRRAPVGT